MGAPAASPYLSPPQTQPAQDQGPTLQTFTILFFAVSLVVAITFVSLVTWHCYRLALRRRQRRAELPLSQRPSIDDGQPKKMPELYELEGVLVLQPDGESRIACLDQPPTLECGAQVFVVEVSEPGTPSAASVGGRLGGEGPSASSSRSSSADAGSRAAPAPLGPVKRYPSAFMRAPGTVPDPQAAAAASCPCAYCAWQAAGRPSQLEPACAAVAAEPLLEQVAACATEVGPAPSSSLAGAEGGRP